MKKIALLACCMLVVIACGGPDGEFGNEDDIVFVRGHLKDTMEVYAKTPLHPSEVN